MIMNLSWTFSELQFQSMQYFDEVIDACCNSNPLNFIKQTNEIVLIFKTIKFLNKKVGTQKYTKLQVFLSKINTFHVV